jgi:hypothetical protein
MDYVKIAKENAERRESITSPPKDRIIGDSMPKVTIEGFEVIDGLDP